MTPLCGQHRRPPVRGRVPGPLELDPQQLDLPRQLGAAAVDPRLDRAFRQVQLVGDLLVRELLDVAQHHRRPQRVGQLLHRRAQQHDAVLLLEDGIRADVVRPRRQLAGIDVAVDRLTLLADAAVVIDAQVAADADEPGLEVRAAVERVQRLEDLQEDVLRQVLRLVVLPDELVRDVEDLPPVLADDHLPGELVAAQAALDELVRSCGLRERSVCGIWLTGDRLRNMRAHGRRPPWLRCPSLTDTRRASRA